MRPSNVFKIISVGVLALSLGAAASPQAAPTAAPQHRACFWAREANNFAYQSPDTVNLRVGVRDVYQLKLFGPCDDISFANVVGFDTRGASSVCDGLGIDLIVRGPLGPQRCPVRSLRQLTPDEIAALPRGSRP